MRAAFGKRMQPALSFSPRLLVFPEECSNAKGAMMSFAPKRPDVFPEERSNAKGAMMSFVPKRLQCVSQGALQR